MAGASANVAGAFVEGFVSGAVTGFITGVMLAGTAVVAPAAATIIGSAMLVAGAGMLAYQITTWLISDEPVCAADVARLTGSLVGGALGGSAGASVARSLAARGPHMVYQGIDKAGVVRYVGRTSREVQTRGAEHIASGGGKENLIYRAVPGGENLTLQQARVMEQQLIIRHGLGKDGGTLMNRINSIAPRYWAANGVTP